MTSFKNHIAVNSSYDVAEICRPLKNLNVGFFCYHRIYNDGSEVMVSSNGGWAEHYYTKGYSSYSDAQYAMEKKFDWLVWPYANDALGPLVELREIADLFYGMSFLLQEGKKSGYVEGFGFGLSKNLDFNFLLNNVELLKKFCSYFAYQISSRVKLSKLEKIAHVDSNHCILTPYPDNLVVALNEHFLNEIKSDQSCRARLLTARELCCVNHLLLGMTTPEVARALNLSPRTVETHLLNLKNKLNCNSKSELIALLIKLGFRPSSELLDQKRGV